MRLTRLVRGALIPVVIPVLASILCMMSTEAVAQRATNKPAPTPGPIRPWGVTSVDAASPTRTTPVS